MKKRIEKALQKALLENGEMPFSLYEFDLKESVEDWTNNTATSGIDFFFAITENTGYVAMVLITKKRELYINKEARDKLKQFWKENYANNIKLFLPGIIQDLTDGFLAQIDVSIT